MCFVMRTAAAQHLQMLLLGHGLVLCTPRLANIATDLGPGLPSKAFPKKNLMGINQVLLLSALCKKVRDEVQAQSKSLTSSS